MIELTDKIAREKSNIEIDNFFILQKIDLLEIEST